MAGHDRFIAWTLSLGVHALAIGVALRAATRPAGVPAEPVRLVFVEPVPPPPLPPGGASAVDVQPQAPPSPVAAVKPRDRAKPREPKPTRPTPRPEHRAEPPPVAPPGTGTPAGSEGGTTAGTAGGVRDGIPGGIVGSAGRDLPRADQVASPPVIVRRVLPEYTRRARAAGVSGLVLLEAVLDGQGRVEDDVRVLQSIPLLDAAAIEALRQWRFRPARDHNQQSVRVVLEVPIRFVLQ